MPRKLVPKQNFLGGEAGYLLEGRSDLAQHQLGCSKLQNFIGLKGGAVTRRPGTRYVKTTQGNKPARLIDWVISYDDDDDMYVVEFSLDSTSLLLRVIRVSDNTVYTPSGSPITVPAAFTSDSLSEIQYVQSAESLFIVHKHFKPYVIQRTATTPTFSVSSYIAFSTASRSEWESLPYLDTNISAITMTINTATVGTGRTLTASANYFTANHVGAYFRSNVSATHGYCKVTGFTDAQNVTVEVLSAFGGTTATTDWQEGAWSTERGWPRTITIYNSRLVFGGNNYLPDTFWASQAFDFFEMFDQASDDTFTIDMPLRFTLSSNKLNEIKWLIGGKKLTIGTGSSEWVGQFRDDGTNLFVEFDEETTHGSRYVQAKKISYAIPFVQRSGQIIREMNFDFNSDSFVATDLNLFANHIGTAHGRFVNSSNVRIIAMAYQDSPFNILWVIDSVGRLYGLTRDKQQQIASWHSHRIGGVMTELIISGLAGDDYPPFVTSICVVPSPNGTLDRLWMVVRREINGVDTYMVEYMDDLKSHADITVGSAANVKSFLDCATVQTAASTVTWSNLTRFASDTCYVVAEAAGGVQVFAGERSVTAGGQITLPTAATVVCAGLHANAELRPLPIEGGDAPEIPMRSLKRVDQVAMRLHQTWGLRIGEDRILRKTGNEENTTFEPIPFDSSQAQPYETFTGVKEVQVPGSSDVDSSFALVMEEPWPCTILSLSSRAVTNEV